MLQHLCFHIFLWILNFFFESVVTRNPNIAQTSPAFPPVENGSIDRDNHNLITWLHVFLRRRRHRRRITRTWWRYLHTHIIDVGGRQQPASKASIWELSSRKGASRKVISGWLNQAREVSQPERTLGELKDDESVQLEEEEDEKEWNENCLIKCDEEWVVRRGRQQQQKTVKKKELSWRQKQSARRVKLNTDQKTWENFDVKI